MPILVILRLFTRKSTSERNIRRVFYCLDITHQFSLFIFSVVIKTYMFCFQIHDETTTRHGTIFVKFLISLIDWFDTMIKSCFIFKKMHHENLYKKYIKDFYWLVLSLLKIKTQHDSALFHCNKNV